MIVERLCTGPAPRVLWLSVPRTGSQHLNHILGQEYGRPEPAHGAVGGWYNGIRVLATPRCTNLSVMHDRPRNVHTKQFFTETASRSSCMGTITDTALRWQLLLQDVSRIPVRLITMVRRPLPWLLSYWSLEHNRSTSILEKQAAFAAFATSPIVVDFQLAFLAGKRLPLPFFHQPTTRSTKSAPCDFRTRHLPPATEEDLDRVRSWLRSGALLAGTTEEFGASVRMFSSQLGWQTFQADGERSYEPRLSHKTTYRIGDATRNPLTVEMIAPEQAKRFSWNGSLDARLYALVNTALAPWV